MYLRFQIWRHFGAIHVSFRGVFANLHFFQLKMDGKSNLFKPQPNVPDFVAEMIQKLDLYGRMVDEQNTQKTDWR